MKRSPGLSSAELSRRARRIKIVLTDNDGVLTDTGVYYSEEGEAFKRYSIRDGMAVELLRNAGIATGILSGETSPNLRRRAEKLNITHLYPGVKNKQETLQTILDASGLTPEETAYIGDDVNDLGIINVLATTGLTGAPADAMPAVLARVHKRGTIPGGRGAFREFADWILALREYKP